MCATTPELALSASYRKAQRLLAGWLDRGRTAQRQVFNLRAAIANLDATERHRLSRWLAWWHVTVVLRGGSILERIKRLEPALAASTEMALAGLPNGIGMDAVLHQRKKSA